MEFYIALVFSHKLELSTVIVLSDQWDNIGYGSGSRSQVWEEVKCENGVNSGSPLLACELS